MIGFNAAARSRLVAAKCAGSEKAVEREAQYFAKLLNLKVKNESDIFVAIKDRKVVQNRV